MEFLPPIAQNFLIDVLEGSGTCAPLGAPPNFNEPPPRFRLISASKKPLAKSGLRPDLTQRLATGNLLVLPTLEERREDIPNLVETILHGLKTQKGYDAQLTSDAIAYLQQANWPGQIRELEATVNSVVEEERATRKIDGISSTRMMISLNAVKKYLEERSIVFGAVGATDSEDDDEATLTATTPLGSRPRPTVSSGRKLPSNLTEQDVRAALAKHQGNKTRAAQELGIALNTLKDRMKRFGVD